MGGKTVELFKGIYIYGKLVLILQIAEFVLKYLYPCALF